MLLFMFAPWAGLLCLVLCPLLGAWALWRRHYWLGAAALAVCMVPLVWTQMFPLSGWFDGSRAMMGGKFSDLPTGLGRLLLLWALPLAGVLGVLALIYTKERRWLAALPLLAALSAYLHIGFLYTAFRP